MTIDDFGFSSYRKEEEKRKQTSFARNRKQEKPNAYLEIHLSFLLLFKKQAKKQKNNSCVSPYYMLLFCK